MPAAADWKLLMGVDPEDLGDDDEKICQLILMVCVHICIYIYNVKKMDMDFIANI